MFKGIEPHLGFKQTFEGQTSFFQEAHVRFAVSNQFFLEIKHHVLVALLLMPCFQGLLGLGGHGFGHVVVEGRDGSHARLVVRDVELVGEVPFSQFSQPKGLGKGREGHLEETE